MLPYLQFEFENKWLPTTSLLNTLGLCIFSIQNNLLKTTVNIILFSVVRDFWKTSLTRRTCWGFHQRRSVTKSTNLNAHTIKRKNGNYSVFGQSKVNKWRSKLEHCWLFWFHSYRYDRCTKRHPQPHPTHTESDCVQTLTSRACHWSAVTEMVVLSSLRTCTDLWFIVGQWALKKILKWKSTK